MSDDSIYKGSNPVYQNKVKTDTINKVDQKKQNINPGTQDVNAKKTTTEQVGSKTLDIFDDEDFEKIKIKVEGMVEADTDDLELISQWQNIDHGESIHAESSDNHPHDENLGLVDNLTDLLHYGKSMMEEALPSLLALDDKDDSTGYFKKLIRVTERSFKVWDGLSDIDKINTIRLYTNYADEYYESHRGYRFTKRGKARKEAINSIRKNLIGFTNGISDVIPEGYREILTNTSITQIESQLDNAMSREELKNAVETDETTYELKPVTETFNALDQMLREKFENQIILNGEEKRRFEQIKTETKDSRTKHMKKYGVGSVKAAILYNNAWAYDNLEEKRRQENPKDRTIPLHRARGKKFREADPENNCVLKFDMGGSGNKVFPIISKNLDTSGNLKTPDKIKTKIKYLKESDYSKLSDEEIQAIKEKNEYIKNLNYEVYGENFQEVKGKRIKGVRKREQKDGKKTKITMAGPDKLGGWADLGKYKIDNLKGYMLEMAKDYIRKRFAEMEKNGKMGKIRIQIRGHSRGAVAANEGALAILDWIEKEYANDEIKKNAITFDVLEFDPVPGPLNNMMGFYDVDDEKMARLNARSETTVVYSLHTQHAVGFVPLKLKNAKRIILTPDYHNAGIKFSETTGEDNKQHMKSYIDAQKGEAYRNSGIQELDEGIYLADEDNVLFKLTSYNEAEKILNQIWKHTSMQGDRHNMILSILKERLGE